MAYIVKELFFTLQGEGTHSGRSAVFCRFTGCNLWSGRESDRATAICNFCDTDFIGTDGPGGGKFQDAEALAATIERCWSESVDSPGQPYVVFTGGEPGLQIDAALVAACQQHGFEVAIETNGTVDLPANIDWICVSPKPGTQLKQHGGNELKFIYPQPELDPADFVGLDFEAFFIQPMDGPQLQANVMAAAEYCQRHPKWRLSLQTHKLIGIP